MLMLAFRLSKPRDAQTGAERQPLCLCARRLRSLYRISSGLGLLGQRLAQQRLLCRGDLRLDRFLFPDLRQREQSAVAHRRIDRVVAYSCPGDERRQTGRVRQCGDDGREDAAADRVHPDRDLRAFNYDKFALEFLGIRRIRRRADLGTIGHQVKSTMLVTLWVFIGIEGASVYSSYAAKRSDVGTATVIGFAGALTIYVLVSLLSTGILAQKSSPACPCLRWPACSRALSDGGARRLLSLGLVISVGGAFLSLDDALRRDSLRRGQGWHLPALVRGPERAAHSPAHSLWVTNGLVQVFSVRHLLRQLELPVSLFFGRLGRDPAALCLLQCLCAEARDHRRELCRQRSGTDTATSPWRGSPPGTVYGLWLCYAADLKYLLLATILFAPATFIYMSARSEQRQRLFSRAGTRGGARRSRSRPCSPSANSSPEASRSRPRRRWCFREFLFITREGNMGRQFGVHSEVGRLRTVMVCRPGLAHQRLDAGQLPRFAVRRRHLGAGSTEGSFRLRAQDAAARRRGTLDLHDLLAQTVAIPEARAWILDRRVTANTVGRVVAKFVPRLAR